MYIVSKVSNFPERFSWNLNFSRKLYDISRKDVLRDRIFNLFTWSRDIYTTNEPLVVIKTKNEF